MFLKKCWLWSCLTWKSTLSTSLSDECDLHARQQTLAMLETTTGEVVNLTLMHEGNEVREFYSQLPRPVLVGIEATGR